MNESAQNLIAKLRGRRRKVKRTEKNRQIEKILRGRELQKETYSPDSHQSLSDRRHVSQVSDFQVRYFCPEVLQASVVDTTMVTYKHIAPVDQSDLEFLIPVSLKRKSI